MSSKYIGLVMNVSKDIIFSDFEQNASFNLSL